MASNDILSAELRREVTRNRYATHIDAAQVYPTTQQLSRELPRILSDYDYPDISGADLNRMTRAVIEAFGGTWSGMWDDITKELVALAKIEADAVTGVYNEYTPSAVVKPTREEVERATTSAIMTLTSDVTQAGTWAQFIRANLDANTRALSGLIRDGYNNGVSLSELIRQIRGTRGADGKYYGGLINNKTRQQAAALARTGVSHYANVGRDQFAAKNKDQIEGRILVATFDNRTTRICMSRHLNFYATGEKYPPLPFHYNERSQYIFKTKGFDPLNNTRPSVQGKEGEEAAELFDVKQSRARKKVTYRGRKSGDLFEIDQVSAKMSFDEFLRDQPRWFVESTLGPERAKLFLDGGLSVDKFTDMTGRPLTLEELKQTSAGARAFRKANNDGN